MALTVVDSDILIDALRGREPARARVAEAIRTRNLATTVISVFELKSGARTEAERAKVNALLAGAHILPLDEPAAEDAAQARRILEDRGEAIGTADYLIAGICRTRSASLLTRNRRHFERVPELRLGGLGDPKSSD
jgi:predicted nucleic acid-binding protein